MSADIVRRLRTRHANDFGRAGTEALMREAADEIERLRHELTLMRVAENGRLVFATEEIERLRTYIKGLQKDIPAPMHFR